MRNAATRPGNSVVIGTGAALSVTTETFGGGGGAGGGVGEHADSATIAKAEIQRKFQMATSLRPTRTRLRQARDRQYRPARRRQKSLGGAGLGDRSLIESEVDDQQTRKISWDHVPWQVVACLAQRPISSSN
jgi:hypothetical protein